MTRIAPGWLVAPETRAVVAALAPARPMFVGGCVRDALMGRKTADLDIAVLSPPDETMRLAEAAGLKAHPTGLEHGVVTLVSGGRAFEAATLRRDVATDGRRAVVAFATDIAEDAARRDFTMNALYADADGVVADPLGEGLADLRARRLRFIGDAEARVREDYLRILRLFRFHAQFDIDAFDPDALAACRAHAGDLIKISKERIGAEIMKLLGQRDPEPALRAMGEILSVALPGAAFRPGLAEAEARLRLAPDPLRRLAHLEATDPAGALRLSRKARDELRALADARLLTPPEAAYRYGAGAAADAICLAAASGTPPPEEWRRTIETAAAATFPIAAADLIAAGAAPGPDLGARLKSLEATWIESGFTATKDALLARA